MCVGKSKPKVTFQLDHTTYESIIKLANKNELAALANRLGVVPTPHRPSSLSVHSSNTTSDPLSNEDSRNNNNAPQRLSSSHTLRLNNNPTVVRPKTINRSASIGIQLWHHSNQHKHQTPRGIDNAVKERMPLVCGVLWRSVAPVIHLFILITV